MPYIQNIVSRMILDSRGMPTVEVDVITESGIIGRASVPSGASTGSHEAVELRDMDKLWNGKGVSKAIQHVEELIYPVVVGRSVLDQRNIDQAMIEIDGTPNKGKLGANAILAVSLAVAKAGAMYMNMPLYQYIGGLAHKHLLPTPMLNIMNGGAHANNGLSIQEFMIMPYGFDNFMDAMESSVRVYHQLKSHLKKQGLSVAVGDEGGFAPDIVSTEKALGLISESIQACGFSLGKEFGLALDIASNELWDSKLNKIVLHKENKQFTVNEWIDYLGGLSQQYHIVSIEDALPEDDFKGLAEMTRKLASVQIVGDDVFVTQKDRLQKAIESKSGNAILIKMNQVGTLTETLDTIHLAQLNGYGVVVSHRSGETEDSTLSDLAVGVSAGQIKTGAPARTDRNAKYNQLLRINDQLGSQAVYAGKRYIKGLAK